MKINLERAAELLINGQVVALPTETVYGLAASIDHPEAIRKIFELKGRPNNNPLIVHVSDVATIAELTQNLPESFWALAKAFWPGPMTLVLEAKIDKIPSIVRADLPTAAFRIPSHFLTKRVLELTGPLVMPSANLSGKPSATLAEHVEKDFGEDFYVLDNGGCLMGVESTILMVVEEKWQIVRQGAIPQEAFMPVLGYKPVIATLKKNEKPLCPGQLYRHYAPKAKLILTKETGHLQNQTILGFQDRTYPPGNRLFSLGISTNPKEIAQNLYKVLRELDDASIELAYVDSHLPVDGLFATLHERLQKAARGS